MPNRRMSQINELLRQEISRVFLKEMSDPRFSLVTVTSVVASADLHNAKVYIHFHGTDEEQEECLEALNVAGGRIRKLIGNKLSIKYTPELNFYYDDRMDYAESIFHKLDELKEQNKIGSQEES